MESAQEVKKRTRARENESAKKNQKKLLIFCLSAWFSVSTSFAQSQGTPSGQPTHQAPPPTTDSTPFGIGVDVAGILNGWSFYTNKFPDFTLALTQGWRAQDVASRRRFAEAVTETPAQLTDKQSATQESAASSTFTYGAETDFNSSYVWRGLLLDDRPVAQPSAWISAFGFTFTAWS